MRIAALALLALTLSACIHSDYIGKSYPATTNVDLFLDEADVREDFEVMGEVTLESDADMDFAISSEDLQEKAMETAREKGADGVILGSLEKKSKGETTNDYGTSSSTTVKEAMVIKARLIKYRKNIPASVTPAG